MSTENAARPAMLATESTAHEGDRYLSLKALSSYGGVSTRWLRYRMADPHRPLPHYRLPSGRLLVRRSDYDQYLEPYRRTLCRGPAA